MKTFFCSFLPRLAAVVIILIGLFVVVISWPDAQPKEVHVTLTVQQ